MVPDGRQLIHAITIVVIEAMDAPDYLPVFLDQHLFFTVKVSVAQTAVLQSAIGLKLWRNNYYLYPL